MNMIPPVEPQREPPNFRPARKTWNVSRKTAIIVLVVIGWLALLSATAQSLLAAIQIGMIGLGAIGTAIVVALWRQS